MGHHRACCCQGGEWTLFGVCGATSSSGKPVKPFYLPGLYAIGTLVLDVSVSPFQCMVAVSQTATRLNQYDTKDATDVVLSTHLPSGRILTGDYEIIISGVSAASCCFNVCRFTCPNITVSDVSSLNGTHSISTSGNANSFSCVLEGSASTSVSAVSFLEGLGCAGSPLSTTVNQLSVRVSFSNDSFSCKRQIGKPGQTAISIQGELCNGPGFFQCYPVYGSVTGTFDFGSTQNIVWDNRGLGLEGGTSCAQTTPLYGGTVTVNAA